MRKMMLSSSSFENTLEPQFVKLTEQDLPSLATLFKAVGWISYTDMDRRLFLH